MGQVSRGQTVFLVSSHCLSPPEPAFGWMNCSGSRWDGASPVPLPAAARLQKMHGTETEDKEKVRASCRIVPQQRLFECELPVTTALAANALWDPDCSTCRLVTEG